MSFQEIKPDKEPDRNKKIEQLDTAQQDEDIISKKEVPDLEEVEPDPSPKKSFWKRLFP